MRLNLDVFVALAAIAWADGKLHPDEADAIVRAAVEEGLPSEEIAQIEAASLVYQQASAERRKSAPPRSAKAADGRSAAQPGQHKKDEVDLGVLDRATLTKGDRLFVYAVACWIARLDGDVTLEESDALAALGERLGVPERMRAKAEALAKQVYELPEGDRPARYDLGKLKKLIGEKLDPSAGVRTTKSES